MLPTVWLDGLQYPMLQSLILMILVVLASTWLPLPKSYQPLLIFRSIATAVANKVNKPTQMSGQQLLSGCLAIVVLVTPVLLLAVAFAELSSWPELWHALLLFICLDWRHVRTQALSVSDSIEKQQLQLAKAQLQPLVLRETAKMSVIGLNKASIETLSLRVSTQWFGVLFWFSLGGGIAALAYRLLYELLHCWNPKLSTFTTFGKPIASLMAVLSFLPMVLAATLIAIQHQWRMSLFYLRSTSKADFRLAQRWLLAATSAALATNLAGPRYYGTLKQSRERIGPKTEPETGDIRRWLTFCGQFQLLSVLLIAGVWLLIWVSQL